MREVFRALLWLSIALLVLAVFGLCLVVLAVFDEAAGWINRKFEALFNELC